MTSEACWKFGANRLSFKGGTDKRTLQLYIIDNHYYIIIMEEKCHIAKRQTNKYGSKLTQTSVFYTGMFPVGDSSCSTLIACMCDFIVGQFTK